MCKKIRCLTCQKFVEVIEVVAVCEKETIYKLDCDHERHVWRKK